MYLMNVTNFGPSGQDEGGQGDHKRFTCGCISNRNTYTSGQSEAESHLTNAICDKCNKPVTTTQGPTYTPGIYSGVYSWDQQRATFTREADGLTLHRRYSKTPRPDSTYYLRDLTNGRFVSSVYVDTSSGFPEFEFSGVRYGILHRLGMVQAKIDVIPDRPRGKRSRGARK